MKRALHDASGTKTHPPAGNQSHTSFSALYSQCYTLRSVYGRTPTWLQNSSLTHKRCHVYSYILSRNSIAKYCNGANHRQVVSGNRAGARTVAAVWIRLIVIHRVEFFFEMQRKNSCLTLC